MSLSTSWADAGHLAVAVALTYALGFERDLRGAPTGDRVFALIGAGAGAVGIIAAHGAPNALAGAITGVGFIGGGLVFRQTLGQSQVLMGITTAAAIFAAAAIGAAAGEGRLLVATMGTVLALLVLEIRHSKVLNLLDGRRYAHKFKQDTQDPHLTAPRHPTPRHPDTPTPRHPDTRTVCQFWLLWSVSGNHGVPKLTIEAKIDTQTRC